MRYRHFDLLKIINFLVILFLTQNINKSIIKKENNTSEGIYVTGIKLQEKSTKFILKNSVSKISGVLTIYKCIKYE